MGPDILASGRARSPSSGITRRLPGLAPQPRRVFPSRVLTRTLPGERPAPPELVSPPESGRTPPMSHRLYGKTYVVIHHS